MAYQRYVTDPAHHDTVIMNAIWTFYNIVILSVAASVAREKRQRRSDVRVDVQVPVTLVFAGTERRSPAPPRNCHGAVRLCTSANRCGCDRMPR